MIILIIALCFQIDVTVDKITQRNRYAFIRVTQCRIFRFFKLINCCKFLQLTIPSNRHIYESSDIHKRGRVPKYSFKNRGAFIT